MGLGCTTLCEAFYHSTAEPFRQPCATNSSYAVAHRRMWFWSVAEVGYYLIADAKLWRSLYRYSGVPDAVLGF